MHVTHLSDQILATRGVLAPAGEPLPQTGIDAERIGLAAIMFLILGMALLLIGRELEYRRQSIGGSPRPLHHPGG